MKVEWTAHAEERRAERKVRKAQVDATIEAEHSFREENLGDGNWRLPLLDRDGRPCAVIYDNPVDGDAEVALVITIVRKRRPRRG
jgi:hypothetical protein